MTSVPAAADPSPTPGSMGDVTGARDTSQGDMSTGGYAPHPARIRQRLAVGVSSSQDLSRVFLGREDVSRLLKNPRQIRREVASVRSCAESFDRRLQSSLRGAPLISRRRGSAKNAHSNTLSVRIRGILCRSRGFCLYKPLPKRVKPF